MRTINFNVTPVGANAIPIETSYIPKSSKTFVPWGNFTTYNKIIKSKKFITVYVVSASGTGKSYTIKEACAKNKRELIAISCTAETSEMHLIGGLRLVDGQTQWYDGPVITAMKRGAVLLLDEYDMLTPERESILRRVLDNYDFINPHTGEVVAAVPGFQVFATANTKGRGDTNLRSNGRYAFGTSFQNEASLERFAITIEQEYPNANVVKKILNKFAEVENIDISENDINKLVEWQEIVRHTYETEGISEYITTRRIVHILRTYAIVGGRMLDSIKLGTARFDEETRDALVTLYDAMTADTHEDIKHTAITE